MTSGLLQATALLFTGSVAAHALPLLLGPALTRLYSPETFGQFALLWAVATNVAVVACARYDHALPLERDDTQAVHLLALADGSSRPDDHACDPDGQDHAERSGHRDHAQQLVQFGCQAASPPSTLASTRRSGLFADSTSRSQRSSRGLCTCVAPTTTTRPKLWRSPAALRGRS